MAREGKKNILINLIFIIFLLSFSACKSQDTEHIHIITLEQLKKEVIGKDVQFVDVRTPKEYNSGHIDDAININIFDKNAFVSQVKQLDKEAPIYIYCHIGGRSGKASKLLEQLGFQHIYDFSAGWKAWKKNQQAK